MYLKTETQIEIAHSLPNYQGPCRHLHGHSVKVEIEVEGDVDPTTGMVVDFVKLKKPIKELDHRELNLFLDMPTAENLAYYLIDRIIESLDEEQIHNIWITVYETPKSSAAVGAYYDEYEGKWIYD